MFLFETFVKYGNRWSYKGTYEALDSRQAAKDTQKSWRRNVIGVRPADTHCKLFVYRFQRMKQMKWISLLLLLCLPGCKTLATVTVERSINEQFTSTPLQFRAIGSVEKDW